MNIRLRVIGACVLLVLCAFSSQEFLAQQPIGASNSLDTPFGISSLPYLRDSETRSISAENPTGERAGGAKAVPDANNPASQLGAGWKVSPSINLPSHQTVSLASVIGPGVIQHIWMTADTKAYRDCVLRFYWDDESSPSIEVPLGDFFAEGHGERYTVNSLLVQVNPTGGFNSYWPMPFRKSAKITIENQGPDAINGFFYQVTYALEAVPAEPAYFHAQWRRSMSSRTSRACDRRWGRGPWAIRWNIHCLGTALEWTVGKRRDEVLSRRRYRPRNHQRYWNRGLL